MGYRQSINSCLTYSVTDIIDQADMPTPDNPGSSGEQSAATGEYLPAEPQTGLHLVDAIEKGLAASPSALGGFGSIMLAGAARQLENENQLLKSENFRLRQSLETRRDALEDERIRVAVLTERVASERSNRHLRNLGISVGAAIASAGLLRTPPMSDEYSIALTIGGALLLIVSWFSPINPQKTSATHDGSER